MPHSVSPSRPRILGYDVARAVAILGMFLVHFGYAMAEFPDQNPIWSAVLHALDGRAAAVFIILAGIGISLRTSSAAATADPAAVANVRRIFLRRGVYLLLFGTALLVIWPAEILRVYGVSMIIAACFITAKSRWLWTAIAAIVFGFIALVLTVEYGENFDWENITYRNLWTLQGQIGSLFYDGFRSVLPWTALLLFGMWLGRQNLHEPRRAWKALAVAAIALVATERASAALVKHLQHNAAEYDLNAEEVIYIFGTESIPPLPLFLLAAGSTAVVVITACLWIARRNDHNPAVRALAATGQLAFTWYITHIVVGLGAIKLLGLDRKFSLSTALATGFAFFLAATVLSLLYKKAFQQGPLEWLMRKFAG